ncbi:CheR family methyltransferase [Novosphingobium sp. JCM 18896]|uniref:CheR family methyltransferase n=1 Tax=Novosphingobium sp. JCM 18896 TaxID=2989731 RepID=UPI0022220EEE|nr:protein-glutamate O-methyltransferase CheR [Novosphingobium sp. JCM 18896]MCW1427550.1 protein-glutamate O-methyltransferase CheR [Novosphingobium sp. JCM 18896]
MSLAAATAEPMPGISPDIYSTADFKTVSELAYSSAGIVLEAGKAMLVYSRWAPLVRESGCGTFAAYIDHIRNNPAEQTRAIGALTTNHTFFYREPHHFEHFAQTTRPKLLNQVQSGQPARLWSAGCSSGEETWSIVMTLLGEDKATGRRIAGSDIRFLASDIAQHALKKASAATYPVEDIEAVPAQLRQPWTKVAGGMATLDDTARGLVRFRTLNLHGQWPMKGQFDVIFCRNVMIYFDTPTKERLISRFAEALVPGGFLYIGHSERVTGPAAAQLQPVGPTIYQRSAA